MRDTEAEDKPRGGTEDKVAENEREVEMDKNKDLGHEVTGAVKCDSLI